MVQWIRHYGLTFSLLLITVGLGYWSLQGIRETRVSLTELQTPFVVASIPTATLTPIPTASAPIAIPTGSQDLTWNPEEATLYGPDGTPRFVIGAENQWVPVLSPDVISKAITKTLPMQDDQGNWVVYDENNRLSFQWDDEKWVWVSAGELPVEIVVDPSNKMRVNLKQGSLDNLIAKSDNQLLEISPLLSPQDYGLDALKLSPSWVFRVGEKGDLPYVVYADDTGQVRLGWSTAEGVIEYASTATYTDEDTGLTVSVLMVNDLSMITDNRYYFSLQPESIELLPKALFEYTLALNHLYSNYHDRFREMIGITGDKDTKLWTLLDKMRQVQIVEMQKSALELLRTDINSLAEGEEISILMSSSKILTFDKHQALFVIRLFPVSYHNYGERVDGAFRQLDSTKISEGRKHIEISVRSENQYILGGFLVEMVREITAGGAADARYTTFYPRRRYSRSTTDSMIPELCSKKVIEQYLRNISATYTQKGVIPRYDDQSRTVPVCLIKENVP